MIDQKTLIDIVEWASITSGVSALALILYQVRPSKVRKLVKDLEKTGQVIEALDTIADIPEQYEDLVSETNKYKHVIDGKEVYMFEDDPVH